MVCMLNICFTFLECYRVIKLENGLTALLIADLHSFCTQDDECTDKGKENKYTCIQKKTLFMLTLSFH